MKRERIISIIDDMLEGYINKYSVADLILDEIESERPFPTDPVRAALEGPTDAEIEAAYYSPNVKPDVKWGMFECGYRAGHRAAFSFATIASPTRPLGYYFHNPDSGWEFSENHPVESGECDDAREIEEVTPARLKELLFQAWDDVEEQRGIAEERGSNLRLIDQISDIIGLPHDVELELHHVRSALSVSTPTGEGELRDAAQMFVNHYPHGLNPYLDKAYALASNALAHPQQGGEREAEEIETIIFNNLKSKD